MGNIEKPFLNPEVFATPFIHLFEFNIDALNYRLNRIWEIDTFRKENQQEYLMAFDAAMALFRCMFLERGKHNYTFQNYFRLTGRAEMAQAIDDYLDSPFLSYADISIRKTLKFITDKYVCHTDNVSYEELGWANAMMSNLRNPYFENNLKNIAEKLSSIINNAPTIYCK